MRQNTVGISGAHAWEDVKGGRSMLGSINYEAALGAVKKAHGHDCERLNQRLAQLAEEDRK